MHRVSVVIPTHNREHLLSRVLDALARQDSSSADLEVIVVDDASTDGTQEMLRAATYPYKLIALCQQHGGPARARNLGASVASGDILVFLDDDIVPNTEFITQHARAHVGHPHAVVQGRLGADPTARRGGWIRYQEQLLERRSEKARRTGMGADLIYSGNFSVTRVDFLAINGFDASMTRDEDIELGFRLKRQGCVFLFAEQAVGIHYGYHGLKAWLDGHKLYGKLAVDLYRDRGYDGGLQTLFGYFFVLHKLNQVAIPTFIRSSIARRLMRSTFAAISWSSDRCHWWRLSYAVYSAWTNCEWWMGVADALGGFGPFSQELQQCRV